MRHKLTICSCHGLRKFATVFANEMNGVCSFLQIFWHLLYKQMNDALFNTTAQVHQTQFVHCFLGEALTVKVVKICKKSQLIVVKDVNRTLNC